MSLAHLLPPEERTLDVLTFSKPLSTARQHHQLAYGMTILEILAELRIPRTMRLFVELDGEPVPRRLWGAKRPRHGQVLAIGVVPLGGGGGGGQQDSNKALRTTLLVVIAIAAIVVSVASYGILTGPAIGLSAGAASLIGGVLGAGVSIAGGLLVNQLLPPKIRGLDTPQQPDATFGITGTRNSFAGLGTPFTRLYGRHKIFPLIAAEPDIEVVGNDQYLTQVFSLGYGPLDIDATTLKIGGTSLFAYQGVQFEIRTGWTNDPPLTLYSNDKAVDVLGQLRLTADTWTVRTSAPDADELSIIVEWPNGIHGTHADGTIGPASCGFAVQYRLPGVTDWVGAPILPSTALVQNVVFYHYADGRVLDFIDPAGSIIDIFVAPVTTAVSSADVVLNEATRTYLRRGYSWPVAIRGQHEVRIIRHAPEDPTGEVVTEMYWTVLKTIRRVDPLPFPGISKVVVRIKATDQLNGVIDELSVVATSMLPDYDPATGQWPTRATRNPASIYRDVLQGRANKRPIPDRLVDLTGLQAWHQECAGAGRTCDYVLDGRTTVRSVAATVAAAGRATIGRPDMKWGVVRDIPQTVVVQHFTQRNSWGYSGQRAHVDLPHGLKIPLAFNEQKDYTPDEIIVYADGFNAANATLLETIDAVGITNPDQAYRLGRYHLACAKLRPETHSFNCDFENLRCTRGDLIDFAHDVISAGITSGRVTAVATDVDGNATGITVDTDLEMETGRRVGFVFRRPTGPSSAEAVVVPGIQRTVTFVAPLLPALAPAVDDLFTYGDLSRETVKLLVKGITRARDLVAQITAIPAAPEIHLADQGPIPAWDPRITLPPIIERNPPKPVVTAIRSDESALIIGPDGSLTTRVAISLTFSGGTGLAPADTIEVRFRKADFPDSSFQQSFFPVTSDAPEVYVLGCEDGVEYLFRIRSQSVGRVSDWTEVRHLVVGKSSPPPDVPMVVLDGRRLRWTYPEPPADLAGFVIRFHRSERRTWEDAQDWDFGVATTNVSTEEIEPTGVTTYLIKAVDTSGNVSVNAGVLVVNLGQQVVENLLAEFDLQAQGYPGTIVNGLIAQGELKANSTSFFWGPDDSEFWKTAGGAAQAGVQSMLRYWQRGVGKAQSTGVASSVFWQDRYAALLYHFGVLPETHHAGSDLVIFSVITAESYRIDYQVSGATLFWHTDGAAAFWPADTAAFWGPVGASGGTEWLPFHGRIRGIQRQVYDFRFALQGTGVQSIIGDLTVKLDAPNVSELFDDFSVPVGGARLPIAKKYRKVKNVTHTFVADGSQAVKLEIVDRGVGSPFLTSGPMLRAMNASLQPASATVDVGVTGY